MFFYDWLERVGRDVCILCASSHGDEPPPPQQQQQQENDSLSKTQRTAGGAQEAIQFLMPRGELLAAVLRAAYDLTGLLMLPGLMGAGAADVVRAACLYMSLALHRCSLSFPLFCLASPSPSASAAVSSASSVLQLQWIDVEAYAELIGVALPNFFESAAVAIQYLTQTMAVTALCGWAVPSVLWHPARVPGRMSQLHALLRRSSTRPMGGTHGNHTKPKTHVAVLHTKRAKDMHINDAARVAGVSDASCAAGSESHSRVVRPPNTRPELSELCEDAARLGAGLSPEQVAMCVALEWARQIDTVPLQTTLGRGGSCASVGQASCRIGQWLDALGLYPHRRIYLTTTTHSQRPGKTKHGNTNQEDSNTNTCTNNDTDRTNNDNIDCDANDITNNSSSSSNNNNYYNDKLDSDSNSVKAHVEWEHAAAEGRCAAVPEDTPDAEVARRLGIRVATPPSSPPPHADDIHTADEHADHDVYDYDDKEDDEVECGIRTAASPLAGSHVRLLLASPCANALLHLFARVYRIPAGELADVALRSGLYRGRTRLAAERLRLLRRGHYTHLAAAMPVMRRLSPAISPWMSLYRALHSSDRFTVLGLLHRLTLSHQRSRDGLAALGRLLQRVLRRHGSCARYQFNYMLRVMDETERHFNGLYFLSAWHASDQLVTFTCLRSGRKTITLNPHSGTIALCYVSSKERVVRRLHVRPLAAAVVGSVEGVAAKWVMDEVLGSGTGSGSGGSGMTTGKAMGGHGGSESGWLRVVQSLERCDGVRRRMRVPMLASRLDALAAIRESAARTSVSSIPSSSSSSSLAAASCVIFPHTFASSAAVMGMLVGWGGGGHTALLLSATPALHVLRVRAELQRCLLALPSAAMLHGVSESAVVAMYSSLVALLEHITAELARHDQRAARREGTGMHRNSNNSNGRAMKRGRSRSGGAPHATCKKDSEDSEEEHEEQLRNAKTMLHAEDHGNSRAMSDDYPAQGAMCSTAAMHTRVTSSSSASTSSFITTSTSRNTITVHRGAERRAHTTATPSPNHSHAATARERSPVCGARVKQEGDEENEKNEHDKLRPVRSSHDGGGDETVSMQHVVDEKVIREEAEDESESAAEYHRGSPNWLEELLACDDEFSGNEDDDDDDDEDEDEDEDDDDDGGENEDDDEQKANDTDAPVSRFTGVVRSGDAVTHMCTTPPSSSPHPTLSPTSAMSATRRTAHNSNNGSGIGVVTHTPPITLGPRGTCARRAVVGNHRVVAIATATPPSARPLHSPHTRHRPRMNSSTGAAHRVAATTTTATPPPSRHGSRSPPVAVRREVDARRPDHRSSSRSHSGHTSSESADEDTKDAAAHTPRSRNHRVVTSLTHAAPAWATMGRRHETWRDSRPPLHDYLRRILPPPPPYAMVLCYGAHYRLRSGRCVCECACCPHVGGVHAGTVPDDMSHDGRRRAQAERLVRRVGLFDAEVCRAGLCRIHAFVQSYRRLRRVLRRRVRRGGPLPGWSPVESSVRRRAGQSAEEEEVEEEEDHGGVAKMCVESATRSACTEADVKNVDRGITRSPTEAGADAADEEEMDRAGVEATPLQLPHSVMDDFPDKTSETAAESGEGAVAGEEEENTGDRRRGEETGGGLSTVPKLRRSSARQRRRHEKRDEFKRERYGEGG